jgi:photosystem II stability/assembly factor-like uncharacterized protein
MTRLDRFVRGFSAATVLIALLFGIGAAPATAEKSAQRRVVALAYESHTDALLKAYPHALYRSDDGGKSWRKLPVAAVEDGEIASLAASPAVMGVMYIAGQGLGVLRTDDGGKTWVERDDGLPNRVVLAIAAHITQPDTVYAVVQDSGVYRSQDGGKSWRLMDRSSQGGISQLIHSNMAGSMQTGWLFAATPKGVRRVMDCFCLWQDAGALGSPARSVAFDPRQPAHIFAATEKGLFRSADGGENWTQMKSPASKISALAFAPSGILYAITEDGALFESADQGDAWKQVNA